MTLREALKVSGWEAFRDEDGESWNTDDLLNSDESQWLDSECTVTRDGDVIIDCFSSEHTELREGLTQ